MLKKYFLALNIACKKVYKPYISNQSINKNARSNGVLFINIIKKENKEFVKVKVKVNLIVGAKVHI